MQAQGSVFVELFVRDLAHHKALFQDALGLSVVDEEPAFLKLRSLRGTILLNAEPLPPGHVFAPPAPPPPHGWGVEIGIVVKDLVRAWEATQRIVGCSVSEIVTQDWGMSDFRVRTAEGFVLRVTTPDPETPE